MDRTAHRDPNGQNKSTGEAMSAKERLLSTGIAQKAAAWPTVTGVDKCWGRPNFVESSNPASRPQAQFVWTQHANARIVGSRGLPQACSSTE